MLRKKLRRPRKAIKNGLADPIQLYQRKSKIEKQWER